MRKFLLLFLILTAVLLSGCLPQAQVLPTPTATTTFRQAPTVGLTVPSQAALLPDPGCTVITQKPTPGPTPIPIYPPVTDTDWVKGPASAKVTIIEYSDFQ
jgi:protein-disulfide isomerase